MLSKKLKSVYTFLGILVAITILLAFFGIKGDDFIPKGNKEDPFRIFIEPSFIEEGQYTDIRGYPQYIGLKFKLVPNENLNITYIEVKESSIVIDREGKSPQTKISSNIKWNKNYNDYVFYYSYETYFSRQISLEVEGSLWGCQNCFMGEKYPYIFTFPITYSIDDGAKQVYNVVVKLPIV
ncbi:MAG: hypothetical protein KC506_02715 [Nanoarchaeota archaeon]|nr:hypothetical protein [Nanoarchaeota archaeon]